MNYGHVLLLSFSLGWLYCGRASDFYYVRMFDDSDTFGIIKFTYHNYFVHHRETPELEVKLK